MIYIYILLAYLVGAIPFSLILGKVLKKTDLRQYGSGNVGSTNAARVLGYKIGILTLILDVSKGLIPTYLASLYSNNLAILIGLFCILGHVYPVYLNFKGGKAVATSLGVFIILAPIGVLLALLVFILIAVITNYIALASMSAAISITIAVYLLNYSINTFYLSLFIALLIVYRHKSNILNLINHKEDKFFKKVNRK